MQQRTAGNENTGLLKVLALAFMFADHAGKMLLPDVPEMRILGRLALPLYAWCLVVGFCYTRSPAKYLIRLAKIGLVCQYPYMVALGHQTPIAGPIGVRWYQPNIFLTLTLGLCALWALREKHWLSQYWGPLLALVFALLLKADYGWRGVLLILCFYACRNSRPALAAMFVSFCLYWGSTSGEIRTLFGHALALKGPLADLIRPWLRLQALAVLSLPLILWRSRSRLRLPLWLGYSLYPAHLLLLLALEKLAGKL